jgi:predicted DNA binding CopG/RHH family protein
MPAKSGTTWNDEHGENDWMNKTKKQMPMPLTVPKFRNEDEEAKWWASAEGRQFLKLQFAKGGSKKQKGSSLVSGLSRANCVQIALRLPVPDLAKAREIAGRKGIGYQTLLKMLVHEGLRREARRQ